MTPRVWVLPAAIALVAYAAIRTFVVPVVDAWSVIGADADGAIVWASLATSNTGFLDDQLTTRLMVIPPSLETIEHRAQWGPSTFGDDGVAGGADSLRPSAQGWELRIGGEGLGARLGLEGAKPGCPPEIGRMGGMVEDGVDGRLVTGPAVVVRSHAEGARRGAALYAFGADVSVGIDAGSDCPAWVRTPDRSWTGAAVDFPVARDVALELAEFTVSFRSAQRGLPHDEWAHASAPERAIARLFGFPPPVTELTRVVVRIEHGGKTTLAPGVVLRWD